MVNDHFKEMTDEKLAFAKNIYLIEFMIDQLESRTIQIEAYAKKNRVFINENKQLINKAKHVVTMMATSQRRTFGNDNLAIGFGDNCDRLGEILELVVFNIAEKNEELINHLKNH